MNSHPGLLNRKSEGFHRETRKLDKVYKEKLIDILKDIYDKLNTDSNNISYYLINTYRSKKINEYKKIYKFYAYGSHRVYYKFIKI